MPTIAEQWLYAIPMALIGFYACKYRWWLGLFPLVWIAMLIKGGTTLYLYDFSGESELYANTGSSLYFFSLTVSAALVLCAILCEMYVGRNRILPNSSPEANEHQRSTNS